MKRTEIGFWCPREKRKPIYVSGVGRANLEGTQNQTVLLFAASAAIRKQLNGHINRESEQPKRGRGSTSCALKLEIGRDLTLSSGGARCRCWPRRLRQCEPAWWRPRDAVFSIRLQQGWSVARPLCRPPGGVQEAARLRSAQRHLAPLAGRAPHHRRSIGPGCRREAKVAGH